MHPDLCGNAVPCLAGSLGESAPPGWRPGRYALETQVLDPGSGPQPVALLLVIGKLLGGAGALLALDKADHHTRDRGVTLNIKTMRRDFEYNTYSPPSNVLVQFPTSRETML